MYDFEKVINDNPVLHKHRDLLKTLSDDRIMCVGHNQNGEFYIIECCDEWFVHYLTKEECLELSEMFRKIAERIQDNYEKYI